MKLKQRTNPVYIKATEFKARCLEIMDILQKTRTTVTITKRGVPVAQLVPVPKSPKWSYPFGCMAGTAKIVGDIVSPTISREEWNESLEEWDALNADPPRYPHMDVVRARAKAAESRRKKGHAARRGSRRARHR